MKLIESFNAEQGLPQSFLRCFLPCQRSRAPRHRDVASLNKNSREIFLTSMQWGDKYFDAQANLCRMPPSPASAQLRLSPYLMVRESTLVCAGASAARSAQATASAPRKFLTSY